MRLSDMFRMYFKKNTPLIKYYRKIYWWLTYKQRGYPGLWHMDLMNAYSSLKSNIKFIQIGSNNGVDGDPIYNYVKNNNWQGVLVEPVPQLFNELKENYSKNCEKLFFENSAIANKNGKLKFYRLKESPLIPKWYNQLGSFNKEILTKHISHIPQFNSLIIEDTVNAITFDKLLEKYDLQEVNLIHIDTEGFDYEILKMIPFNNLNIDLIMFEHIHLSIPDYKQAQILLKKNGYKVRRTGKMDTIAVKESVLNKILYSLKKVSNIP